MGQEFKKYEEFINEQRTENVSILAKKIKRNVNEVMNAVQSVVSDVSDRTGVVFEGFTDEGFIFISPKQKTEKNRNIIEDLYKDLDDKFSDVSATGVFLEKHSDFIIQINIAEII